MPETNDHPFIGFVIFHFIFRANLHSNAVFWSILIGSIMPDISMLLFYIWFRMIKHDSEHEIFDNEYYHNTFWDTTFNYSHSIPITAFLAIVCFIIYYAIFSRNQNIYWQHSRIQSEFRRKLNQQQANKSLNVNIVELNQLNVIKGSIMSSDMDVNEISITYDDEDERNISNNLYIMNTNNDNDNNNNNNNNNNIDTVNIADDNNKRVSSNINCRNCLCNTQSFFILSSYFCFSMSIHCICDFPLHSDDAHAQFVPFSHYIFHSPVSYWDYNHYAYIVSPLLSIFVIITSIWLYKHKKNDWKQQKNTICGREFHSLLYFMVICLIINGIVDGISCVQGIYHSIKLLVS